MKKNEKYEGEVLRLKFPNKGIVKVEGEEETVQVKNTLPGQRISFQLTKNRASKKEGRLLEVLEKSELETEIPPCPHFEHCGGCAYQMMDYETQRELKLEQVKALFEHVCPEFPLEACIASPAVWEYRNKMEFSFGDEEKGGALTLGLHKRNSFYDIVPVEKCQIVTEDIRRILTVTTEYFRKKGATFFHKISHEGYLRHLLVRNAAKTGEILVCLVTTSQNPMDLSEYRDLLLAEKYAGKIAGILHMVNDGFADVVKADSIEILYGQDFFDEEILGLRFKISPFSFFQTNSAGAEVLYETAREYTGDVEGKVIFDLYSGTGTIAQVLAPVAKKVVGVEIVEEAVLAARANAERNGLSNCEFIAGDVLKVIDEIEEKPDFIVLDPPREGVHPKALKKIINYGVDKIVYISCKPTSLVRDLEMFLENGYVPERAVCVDLFPWTRGVETCVLLTHKKPTSFIEVTMDYETIVPNQKPGKATYKMITDYVKEKYDLVVKSTTIAEVKRSFGLEVGNYNVKEEKTNYRKEKITPEKRQAVEDALRHFGVIE